MKRLIQALVAIAMTALLAAPAQAAPQSTYKEPTNRPGKLEVPDISWYVSMADAADLSPEEMLDYAVWLLVEEGPDAVDHFMNPEPDGSTEYGDYDYYTYAGSKGGSYKDSSGGGRDAGRSGETDEIDVLSLDWGIDQRAPSTAAVIALTLILAPSFDLNDEETLDLFDMVMFEANAPTTGDAGPNVYKRKHIANVNPEPDGSTEYGDYDYYSYAGSKGGSYKASSSGDSGASGRSDDDEWIDVLALDWGAHTGSSTDAIEFALTAAEVMGLSEDETVDLLFWLYDGGGVGAIDAFLKLCDLDLEDEDATRDMGDNLGIEPDEGETETDNCAKTKTVASFSFKGKG